MEHKTLLKNSCILFLPKFRHALAPRLILTKAGLVSHHQRCQTRFISLKVSASEGEGSSSKNDPASNDPSTVPTPAPTAYATSSAIAIPAGFRSAGAVFILAGFLKILIVCFPYSTMAISMYLQGRADLGPWAAFKMLPFALGLLALSKSILDRRLNERKWFHRGVVVAGIFALVVSRWAFARPRPSPLDPVIAAHQRQVAAAMAQERMKEAEGIRLRQQGRRLEQPSEEARKALLEKQGTRFTSNTK